jgi:UDP-2,3-diacylglucosamine hydrolase
MKLSIVSDVHVKEAGDQAEALLLSFLENPDVQSSDGIFLLGDIFDMMIGPHSQYFSRFHKYFNAIKFLLEQGKKIYYVEGNHDFHLRNLYNNFFRVNTQLDQSLFQMQSAFIIKDGEKSIYLSHGDDIELGNPNYKIYKKIVTSHPLKLYANYLMPYFLITKIGESSSEKSRQRNNLRYSKEAEITQIRENFRKSAPRVNLIPNPVTPTPFSSTFTF